MNKPFMKLLFGVLRRPYKGEDLSAAEVREAVSQAAVQLLEESRKIFFSISFRPHPKPLAAAQDDLLTWVVAYLKLPASSGWDEAAAEIRRLRVAKDRLDAYRASILIVAALQDGAIHDYEADYLRTIAATRGFEFAKGFVHERRRQLQESISHNNSRLH